MKDINLTDLLADIHTLTNQLAQFEDKYGLLTTVFYEWYSSGNEPEDDAWVMDFAEWAGLHQSYRLLTTEYHDLLQKKMAANRNAINRHIWSHARAAA